MKPFYYFDEIDSYFNLIFKTFHQNKKNNNHRPKPQFPINYRDKNYSLPIYKKENFKMLIWIRKYFMIYFEAHPTSLSYYV